LILLGSFHEGFVFDHADGKAYGSAHFDSAKAQKLAQAFRLLTSMGFEEKEAHAMLDGVRPQLGGNAKVTEIVTEALRRWPLPDLIRM
jgi:Holliday junction resolvasome RuvABC DNA-binding subunit